MTGELEAYLTRQWDWSHQTFGPALRTKGIVQHITKELREVEANPHDLSEWVDIIILAMDGYWRHGGAPADLLPTLQAKQDKNFARTWPDWRTMGEDQAIEHDRSGEHPDDATRLFPKEGAPESSEDELDRRGKIILQLQEETKQAWEELAKAQVEIARLKVDAADVPILRDAIIELATRVGRRA